MRKPLNYLALGLLVLLGGCPKRATAPTAEAPRDYDAVRRHAAEDHKDLDKQRGE